VYIIFRCDCGRALYAREGVKARKCVCGKTIKVKTRRILGKVESFQDAAYMVRKLQEEKYGPGGFLQKRRK